MSKELLQDLADRIGCTYISDLKYIPEPELIKVCIKEFQTDTYPISEWTDAVHYLTRDRIVFTSGDEAKKYLINCQFPRQI